MPSYSELERIIDVAVLVSVLLVSLKIIIYILIIRAICKYQAKKNAEAFDYDYLAERVAEEICQRTRTSDDSCVTMCDNSSDWLDDLNQQQ